VKDVIVLLVGQLGQVPDEERGRGRGREETERGVDAGKKDVK
jgi:hypothetical protein